MFGLETLILGVRTAAATATPEDHGVLVAACRAYLDALTPIGPRPPPSAPILPSVPASGVPTPQLAQVITSMIAAFMALPPEKRSDALLAFLDAKLPARTPNSAPVFPNAPPRFHTFAITRTGRTS